MTDASPPQAVVSLGPVSFIVLGMLATCGPMTSYELKREVDNSVGYFWSFPRSQLYAEPQRLSRLGYLEEQQEDSGRRRRVFSITETGRGALHDWLAQSAGAGELRDPGLLKLFFSASGPAGTAQAIAAEQEALHQQRLAEYVRLQNSTDDSAQPLSPTLRMGLLYEEASVKFWRELAQQEQENVPVGAPDARIS
ncbi:PadR family transcriptional regulator [Deinococcus sp. KNUC1210]|uniref:PadR family transcriptional regulator n=1 Tax=Deinococcus sp. KNUC1210 TaxID=2917691 RepID=UPI001EF13856|nr:PadR family transcriptional regulator [Deinococcus sp. KNUC1210]ULH14635.1 PadR family transcriptional regulator [Deinococcus sp. KNUC1210]